MNFFLWKPKSKSQHYIFVIDVIYYYKGPNLANKNKRLQENFSC